MKLGSLLGEVENLSRRKMLAVTAFRSMWSLWLRRQHVSERLRLRLCNVIVRPVLLYYASTWGQKGSETDKLNAFHRKQLRLLIGIKYLQIISNLNLYERCECREIGTDVKDMRRRLFGHILHLDEKAPANQAVPVYFETEGLQGHRGRQPLQGA